MRRWVSLLTCLCLAGASAGYAWFCNGCYRTNYYSNEIMASYYTSMLTRARSMEGYTPDLEIVFVGQYVEDPTLCDLWSGTPFIMGGRSTASVQINEYGRLRMIVMSTGMVRATPQTTSWRSTQTALPLPQTTPPTAACGSRTASCSSVSATRARYIIIESRRCFPVDSRPVRCYNQNRYNSTDIDAPAAPCRGGDSQARRCTDGWHSVSLKW